MDSSWAREGTGAKATSRGCLGGAQGPTDVMDARRLMLPLLLSVSPTMVRSEEEAAEEAAEQGDTITPTSRTTQHREVAEGAEARDVPQAQREPLQATRVQIQCLAPQGPQDRKERPERAVLLFEFTTAAAMIRRDLQWEVMEGLAALWAIQAPWAAPFKQAAIPRALQT